MSFFDSVTASDMMRIVTLGCVEAHKTKNNKAAVFLDTLHRHGFSIVPSLLRLPPSTTDSMFAEVASPEGSTE